MDHIAIMRKSWNLIPKIITGEKYIESRWYKTKRAPWDKITSGDCVYFKNSGEDVIAKATVKDVIQYDSLTLQKCKDILNEYGDGIGMSYAKSKAFLNGKNYCILVFLQNPILLEVPFKIEKKGFGISCAWITCKSINAITINSL